MATLDTLHVLADNITPDRKVSVSKWFGKPMAALAGQACKYGGVGGQARAPFP